VAIRLRKGGTVLLGDLEAVSDSFAWPRRDNNPYFDVETEERGGQKIPVGIKDERVHHFLDIHGNEWDLESGSYDILDLNGFPYQDGSPDVLVLHGTSLEDPKPEQIGVEEVTTPKLKELTYPHSPHAFEKYSRLMHFVHRHDIMGQANLIFWPWHRWGVIR
jgi:hypothetical protein